MASLDVNTTSVYICIEATTAHPEHSSQELLKLSVKTSLCYFFFWCWLSCLHSAPEKKEKFLDSSLSFSGWLLWCQQTNCVCETFAFLRIVLLFLLEKFPAVLCPRCNSKQRVVGESGTLSSSIRRWSLEQFHCVMNDFARTKRGINQ